MDCEWRKGEVIVRIYGEKELELFQDNFNCKNVEEQWVSDFLVYIYFDAAVESDLEEALDNVENIIDEADWTD